MNKRLLPVCAVCLLLAAFLAGCAVSIDLTPPPPAGYLRRVSVESVYVRSCPAVSCDVRTVAYRGQPVRVYEYRNGWAYVTLPETGATGWMDARYLSTRY